MNEIIGQPIDRVDGRLKVTGKARYAADVAVANLAYGVMIQSSIARGRIIRIDTSAAENAAGVLGIVTHLNAPELTDLSFLPAGQSLPILKGDRVYYCGQQLGVAIAQTLEQALHAVTLVEIEYEEEVPSLNMEEALIRGFKPDTIFGFYPAKTARGDIKAGLARAEVCLERVYTTPMEHHNPIEPSATLAIWEGEHLTLYDATQGVSSTRQAIAQCFNLPPGNVRVVSEFLGGGFGCKAMVWPHTVIAAVAARHVNRPVKLVLTRQQMYSGCGYRSPTEQHLTLGATKEGKLTSIVHQGNSLTSQFDDFVEPVGLATKMMYACENLEIEYRLGRIDAGTPTFMRAPGEAPGMFALESAMDELAVALKIDPIELRMRNYAEVEPGTGYPWSSKSLKECYFKGAELFGWEKRNPEPGSMKDKGFKIGWGMASATFPVRSMPASARVRIFASGEAIVESGAQDLGTGTYTVMTQVAAEALGLPKERVRFKLGDTDLPKAPVAGNSMTVNSVAPAVQKAAMAARREVIGLAIQDRQSPLYGVARAEIQIESGRLFCQQDPSLGETYQEILTRNGKDIIVAGEGISAEAPSKPYGMHSFGANFAEVKVDPILGEVRVTRYVGVYGAGRILNPKTARSQAIGGIIGGIGMALMEHTVMDSRSGRILNANLSEYLIPVNADIPDIEVVFLEECDSQVNSLGTKGIGELPIVGVAAAIANAVYHATGKRIRDLPITPDKLL